MQSVYRSEQIIYSSVVTTNK